MTDALTIDVEEYFQVSVFRERIPPERWGEFPRRAADSVRRLLDLLAARGSHATFFVLGWVAERESALMREIVAGGHEIASHGYAHTEVTELEPWRFRADLARARDAIGEACGVHVVGFRAPSWSIGPRTAWALDVLAEEGYAFDSSIFPIRHDRYGWPGRPRAPHRIATRSGEITEVPPATARLFGANVPVAGGGYLRHFPFGVIRRGISALHQEGLPAVLYLHPWEIDPGQPRMAGVGLVTRVRHYRNLGNVYGRLDALLADARFGTIADLLAAHPPRECVERAA